jgi:hypothetical protein
MENMLGGSPWGEECDGDRGLVRLCEIWFFFFFCEGRGWFVKFRGKSSCRESLSIVELFLRSGEKEGVWVHSSRREPTRRYMSRR